MRSAVQMLGLCLTFLTITLMGAKGSIAQDGGNYRGEFTSFLANPPSGANGLTVGIVSGINGQLARDGVPMSKNHYDVAKRSIANGDDIFTFASKENAEVMKSSGQGWFYGVARFFHSVFFGGGGDGGGKSKGLSIWGDRDMPYNDSDFFKPRPRPWIDLGLW
jgi:hypothetical protein